MFKMLWAGAKNLVTDKLEVIACDEMYVMKDDDKLGERYKPESVTDFDPNQHYGVARGDQMVLFHIRGLDVSEELILERINTPRHPQQIRGKKRLSASQPSIPIARLINGQEIAEAMKKSEAKKRKKKAGKETEKSVLTKFFDSRKDKSANDSKRKKENKAGGNDFKKPRTEKITEKSDSVPDDQTEKDKQPNAGKDSEVKIQNGDAGNEPREDIMAGNEPREDIMAVNDSVQDLPPCSGNCQMVRFLQQQLHNLTEGLAKGKGSGEKKDTDDRNLNVKFGVPCDIALEEDQIHIGDSIIVKFKDVTEVECATFDRRARVSKLLEVCFPSDFQLRTLDPAGMKDTTRQWLRISKANIHCITKLLNHMAASDGITKPYKDQEVRSLVSKVSKYNRDRMDFDELDGDEKKKIMEEKKEKARQQRQKRQEQKRKEQKEARKKKKEEKGKKQKETSDKDSDEEDVEKSTDSDTE